MVKPAAAIRQAKAMPRSRNGLIMSLLGLSANRRGQCGAMGLARQIHSPPRARKLPEPQLGLAGDAVADQARLDLAQGGLVYPVPRVALEPRHRLPRNRPARPGPPAALLPSRLVHPVGIVLEVDPGIADEDAPGRV